MGAAPRGRVPLDENAAKAAAIADAREMATHGTAAPAPRTMPLRPRSGPVDRQPFGTQEQQLAHAPIPGFRLYWFNDSPGRIARAKRAGYEHVLDDSTGSPLCRNVGRGEGGGGQNGYLMKIPVEWYHEDMTAAQEKRDRDMRDIRAGRHGASAAENQYVPAAGIRIEDRR